MKKLIIIMRITLTIAILQAHLFMVQVHAMGSYNQPQAPNQPHNLPMHHRALVQQQRPPQIILQVGQNFIAVPSYPAVVLPTLSKALLGAMISDEFMLSRLDNEIHQKTYQRNIVNARLQLINELLLQALRALAINQNSNPAADPTQNQYFTPTDRTTTTTSLNFAGGQPMDHPTQ